MTYTITRPELTNWIGGLYVGMEVTVVGAESLANDGIAFGAAIADLTREGWRLDSLERSDDRAVAKFFRSWQVGREPERAGPLETMGFSDAAPSTGTGGLQ